jgi:hypothetical protein
MTHIINLVIQGLFTMLMVSKLEDLLQTFYGYFSSSPNHHFQFTKLVAIVKIKGPKINWNLKKKMDKHVSTFEVC